ncbi:DNA glycosylase and apyrimidinic (AP) lyase (endonuclease III) [Candidatus Terasakiella magnetica]|uniref:Endonuclease III n=1 Tax=Candidatus Terasakiella magnetica TaxID=1867952 RepID=A0A1C3RGW0_9PROT|nr:endonuclease III [Candidatus Terasakiella magnetica]SCA56488.1 DNA glycosylase and apyrimidinic (AP) lyase (endonuclease III) [Candidatus Terasakiella magnetica]
MKKADREELFRRFEEDNPEPEGELDYTNVYTLLVAVALSAQATDVGVNKATKKLFQIVSTPQDMLDLGEPQLKDHIKTIGLYNSKAKNVMKAAQMLVDLHDGVVPNDQKALEALPGVGRKTANVVRNLAWGEHTMAVDTHIFRLGNRTGLAKGKTVLEVEKKLMKAVPIQYMLHAHHWLILHGRYICKARKPECAKCIIYDLCSYKAKTV